ncbi:MAG: helix-turn-helix domain-containing protein [Oscillospiraceae bacterium]|nr:helix-turn-helix domain-containing protein [Oscillospiraceae bacterium]
MDQIKTGRLIRKLRTERGLTQKQLAERIHVSDKAVSKWECGNGSPDIAVLSALAEAFGTEIQVLLSGEIDRKEREKGNMKKLKFYVCGTCGNIVTATSEAAVTCCGGRLRALEPKKAAAHEQLSVEEADGEWYITSAHPMTKAHYISFAAYLTDSSVMISKQYPEWDMQMRLPIQRAGRLLWYCSECGLLYQELRPNRK